MKKQIFITIALTFMLAFGVKAEPGTITVTIADVVEQPGTVNIPVSLHIDNVDAPGVGSIELIIDYDTDVLIDFIDVTNIHTDISDWSEAWGVQDPTDPGQFKISFTAADEADYLTDFPEQVLFDIQFDYAGDYSDITFVNTNEDGGSEIGEDTATPITATFVDGSITQAPPIPIALWSLLIGFGLISLFTLKRSARNR